MEPGRFSVARANSRVSIEVGKEPYGWAIRIGKSVKSPFWSKEAAIREANMLAGAIRLCGACVDMIVEEDIQASEWPDVSGNGRRSPRPSRPNPHPRSKLGEMRVSPERSAPFPAERCRSARMRRRRQQRRFFTSDKALR